MKIIPNAVSDMDLYVFSIAITFFVSYYVNLVMNKMQLRRQCLGLCVLRYE